MLWFNFEFSQEEQFIPAPAERYTEFLEQVLSMKSNVFCIMTHAESTSYAEKVLMERKAADPYLPGCLENKDP